MLDPRIVAEIRETVGPQGVFTAEEQLRTYETDGLASYRQMPALVVLPESTAQVQAVVRLRHRAFGRRAA
jgi:glycolate oxidase